MSEPTTPEKPAKKVAKKAPKKSVVKKDLPAPTPDEKVIMQDIDKIVANTSADKIIADGPVKIMLFMKRGASYRTASGAIFTKAEPFQLVTPDEAIILLQIPEDRFEKADPERVKRFYVP